MVKRLVLICHFSVHSTVTDDPGPPLQATQKNPIISLTVISHHCREMKPQFRSARIFVFDSKVYKTGETFSEGA